MSIDAIVEKVIPCNEHGAVTLELVGRTREDGTYSPPGQRYLRMVNPRWVPEVGTQVWGGASSVEFVTEPRRVYTRWGYVKIFEEGREDEMRQHGYPR